ncbi:ribbon-helix-helix domain-containing protein [Nodularia chucula]|uniref:ribbon-helix-helix domain-containing protein n=1 Tax=Nodularia chucula TaxID=3093667 RepID=UPI0039C5D991
MGRKATHGQRKENITLTLTPEGVELLEVKAKTMGISKSEFIERIARNLISENQEEQLLGECSAS